MRCWECWNQSHWELKWTIKFFHQDEPINWFNWLKYKHDGEYWDQYLTAKEKNNCTHLVFTQKSQYHHSQNKKSKVPLTGLYTHEMIFRIVVPVKTNCSQKSTKLTYMWVHLYPSINNNNSNWIIGQYWLWQRDAIRRQVINISVYCSLPDSKISKKLWWATMLMNDKKKFKSAH